jgi:hypothetical protein
MGGIGGGDSQFKGERKGIGHVLLFSAGENFFFPFKAFWVLLGHRRHRKMLKNLQTVCLGPFELILGNFFIFHNFRLFSLILVDFST